MQRSGTALGANHREAMYAESTSDFVHKLQIAQKECNETMYWLELLKETGYIAHERFDDLIYDVGEMMYMLMASVVTARKKVER